LPFRQTLASLSAAAFFLERIVMKLKTPYVDLLPPLASHEFEALKADIKLRGVLQPILIDEDGNILDGHHRYLIDKNAETKVISGLSEAEKIAFVLSSNNKRRNLTPEQRGELRQRNIEVANRLKEEDPKKWTQAKIAVALGVSRTVVESWLDISNDKSVKAYNDARLSVSSDDKKEIVEQVLDGKPQSQVAADFGITQARVSQIVSNEKKKKEKRQELEAIAANDPGGFKGVYDVVVIDPPWPMEKIEREVAPNQVAFDYPTMAEEEMASMQLPLADDCHVWVWTTHKFLPMALRLLDSWGLKYVCTFTWHKPGGFQPFGLPQYNCEFALYARKGSPKFIDTKNFNVCFNAPRGKHSEKPEEFYDVVRRVTDGKRIDIFNRRAIDGFDRWGNEA